MKWKTKFGKCIYVSPSGYKVYQNFFYRWLTLGSSALQTVINRHNPQKPVLYYIPVLTLMARKFPGTCCVLGLGGASVPQLLISENTDQNIVVIDNSEEVIQIAKQFFMVDSIPGLTLIQQNANDYLRECTNQYKHLIIDLYDANHFPAECNNEEFFIHAKNRVTHDGFLAINLANYKEQWPVYQFIKKHFKNILVIPVKKSANMVIIASADENHGHFMNQIESSHQFKRIVWMDSWGFVGKY
jgi:spermidine synthase